MNADRLAEIREIVANDGVTTDWDVRFLLAALAAAEQERDDALAVIAEWVRRAEAAEKERDEWQAKADELARLEFVGDPAADARVRAAEARLAETLEALDAAIQREEPFATPAAMRRLHDSLKAARAALTTHHTADE